MNQRQLCAMKQVPDTRFAKLPRPPFRHASKEKGASHCACKGPRRETSRRKLLQEAASLVFLSAAILAPQAPYSSQAAEGSSRRGIGRYIKKKSLEPLETYVPAVVAARNQLRRAGTIMKDDLQKARELLRSGAFDGLRDNIRALGDYAEQGGNKDAKKLVDDFFLASQDFDFTLFQAKRYSEPVGEKSEAALQKNLDALQRLLATVPQSILDDSEKIVRAVEDSFQAQPSAPKEGSDKQLYQLLQLVPS